MNTDKSNNFDHHPLENNGVVVTSVLFSGRHEIKLKCFNYGVKDYYFMYVAFPVSVMCDFGYDTFALLCCLLVLPSHCLYPVA